MFAFTLLYLQMSDVEQWLQNHVSEGSEEDAIVSKEEMWKSFCCKSDIKVGRELFFNYLGLALSRLEYKNVVPIIKKCRRVGYKGLILLSAPVSDKKAQSCDKNASVSVTPLEVKAPESLNEEVTTVWQSNQLAPQTSIQRKAVQEWMSKYYREGGENDITTKQNLWIHYKESNELDEDPKRSFFSHLGNVIRHPPFAKVRQIKRKKLGAFQFLKRTLPSDVKARTCEKQPSSTRSAALAEAASDLTSVPAKRNSFQVKETSPDRSKSHFGGQRSVPRSPCTILTDLESVLERNPDETYVISSDIPLTSGDSEIFEIEGDFSYDKNEFSGGETDIFPIDSPEDIARCPDHSEDGDGENVSQPSEHGDASSESDVTEMSSGAEEIIPVNKTEASSDIFHRFHKKLSTLLPSHLPGKPASFQDYLTSVVKDPGNINEERTALYLASGCAKTYKNCIVRAFVAASFPPLKVGSFAAEQVKYTFEGDVFPQFTHIEKSNFSCAICIPYLRWAIINSIPHSKCRAQSAKPDAILSGTATLCFSGMVQLKEHSSSRLHLEAVAFFQRAQEEELRCGRKKEARLAGKEQKRISEYFQKPSVNLN